MRVRIGFVLTLGLLVGWSVAARADRQVMPPGAARIDLVCVDAGSDGICDTTAAGTDIQAVVVGQGFPYQAAIACAGDGVANTAASGDDRQLVAVNADCGGLPAIDSGPDGIVQTTADAADVQTIPIGSGAPDAACVTIGPDATCNTTILGGSDDGQTMTVGEVDANAPVIRCGPNGIVDTTANNFIVGGDDVQLDPAGGSCSGGANSTVVDAGPNGIAETRAEGPELLLKVGKRAKVRIAADKMTGSKTVKFDVRNMEYGAGAPATRSYRVEFSHNCPAMTVSQVDADRRTDGLQATASVPLGGKISGSFVVSFLRADVTSVSTKIPYRCQVEVYAIVDDLSFTQNNPDDAANDDSNYSSFMIEVFDKNDL